MAFSDLLVGVDLNTRAVLGEQVSYKPGGFGIFFVVQGIFDAAYQFVEAGQPGVSSSHPGVFLRLEDLPTNPCDDLTATVTVGGTEYKIFEAKPDGQGGVMLRLLEAP